MGDDIISGLIAQLEAKASELKEIHSALKLVQKVSPVSFEIPDIHSLLNGCASSSDVSSSLAIQRKSDVNIKPDTFYGMDATAAAEKYLSMIGHATGFEEIYRAMLQGGLDVSGEDQKKKFNISLTRANQKFKKFGSGLEASFGLHIWYPKKKSVGSNSNESEVADELREEDQRPELDKKEESE